MKPFFQLLILSLLFATSANGQVPGFQGKKSFVDYNLYYMIAIGGPTANGKMYAYNNLGLSTRHNFRWNQCISRQGVAGIGFDYFKTGVDLDYYDEQNDFQTTFSKMKATAISIHYDHYNMKRGSLAPLGLYHHFEAKYITAKAEATPFQGIKTTTFYTGYGLGFRKLFKNKFFLNFSGQIGWTWGDRSTENNSDNFQENVRNRLNQRIYSHYIFENNIGIGLLLF